MNKIDLSIIIPAYNEEKSIKKSITNLLHVFKKSQISFELIIINDGSQDSTLEIIEKFVTMYSEYNIYVLNNKKNIGKSASLNKGFKIAKGNFTAIHDADLEYDPTDLLKMFNFFNEESHLDSIYGSRYLNKNKQNKQNIIYYLANIFNLKLFNFLFNAKLTDLHSCYKIFKTNILKEFDLKEKKFGFELEVSILLIKNKLKIHEMHISYQARSKSSGKKISFLDEINFLITIFKFRFFK